MLFGISRARVSASLQYVVPLWHWPRGSDGDGDDDGKANAAIAGRPRVNFIVLVGCAARAPHPSFDALVCVAAANAMHAAHRASRARAEYRDGVLIGSAAPVPAGPPKHPSADAGSGPVGQQPRPRQKCRRRTPCRAAATRPPRLTGLRFFACWPVVGRAPTTLTDDGRTRLPLPAHKRPTTVSRSFLSCHLSSPISNSPCFACVSLYSPHVSTSTVHELIW